MGNSTPKTGTGKVSRPPRPVHGSCRLLQEPGYPIASVNERVVCGLLQINEQAYIIRPISIMQDEGPVVVGYRLTKTTGPVVYDVNCEAPSQGYRCDCPDWIFRREHKDPRGCKHCLTIQSLRERCKLK